MQDDFPLIEVSDKGDMKHVFEIIRGHAIRLVQKELEKDGLGQDKDALLTCQKAIDKVSTARHCSVMHSV